MKKWRDNTISKAKELRQQGYSYGQINKKLKIPKSTLHYWIGNVHLSDEHATRIKTQWIKAIQPLGALANKKEKDKFLENIRTKTQKEMKKLTPNNLVLKSILSTLYWAEGSKGRSSSLIFANTDPKLVLLYLTLLRNCYPIDEPKLRIRLHLHYYHKSKKIKEFWSNLLNIPIKQFGKIYWKKRSKTKKFRQNFGGICFVGYNNVRLKDEIMACALATQEKLISHLMLS